MKRIVKMFFAAALPVLYSISLSYSQTIHEAAEKGDLPKLQAMISADKKKVNEPDEKGYYPVVFAAKRTHWDIVKYMIENGARVNAYGPDGNTAIYCAAIHDNPDMIEYLIERGADIEAKNWLGYTPLHVAAFRDNKKAAVKLLMLGADTEAGSKENWTPLHLAVRCGHKDMADILIGGGASLSAKDDFDKIPLDYNFLVRPEPKDIDPAFFNEYVGVYSFGNGVAFTKVWIENDVLWLEDYVGNELYPIGKDEFFCTRAPWKISFQRDNKGIVNKITLHFLRRDVSGEKMFEKKIP
ncbi:ankyrin repeat domain-containing protein [candidate division KSB1 bacterium]